MVIKNAPNKAILANNYILSLQNKRIDSKGEAEIANEQTCFRYAVNYESDKRF